MKLIERIESPSKGQKMSTPIFARHETFHPRYGWLKKGFDAAVKDSTVFNRDDAHVRLGVGKNMVRAIKYWCHAFKVLHDPLKEEGKSLGSTPTDFGNRLLGEGGYDPYLEDVASLWLLHWKLLHPPCSATAWEYTFFRRGTNDITVRDLTTELTEHVARTFPNARAAESSLKKDAACIIRMYGELSSSHAVTEETIHCPFAELRLLSGGPDRKAFTVRTGRKPGLSSAIIAAACFEYVHAADNSVRTVSINRLTYGHASPGTAFKLSEHHIYEALDMIASDRADISLADTAGVVQVAFASPPGDIADQLIEQHYAAQAAI